MADADSGQSREGGQHRAERDDLCAVACAVGLAFSPPVVGDRRARGRRTLTLRDSSWARLDGCRRTVPIATIVTELSPPYEHPGWMKRATTQ